MVTILDARPEDLRLIADFMSEDDLKEISCTRDMIDAEALARDALVSEYCKVAFDNGRPVMAFGAKRFPQLDPSVAFVWGFKTDLGWRAVRAVTKHIRRIMIPTLHSNGVSRAACFVHKENGTSCRWLSHLGFVPKASLAGVGTPHKDLILFLRDDSSA